MKKYIQDAGFKFVSNYDDMLNKQFSLVGVTYLDGIETTLNAYKLDRVEVYVLFLKDFDAIDFKTKLESIISSAISNSINVASDSSFTVDNVENGYNVTMEFNIKG